MNLAARYQGKRVFITGHTGFKGAWLSECLLFLGAQVTGYSLPAPTEPALFEQLGLEKRVAHIEGDVRLADSLREAIVNARPDFVFHLAAQSLVRTSYLEPRQTYEVNVIGTVNLLEGLRAIGHPCAAVLVTSDKCYEDHGLLNCYQEQDRLGGHDPYSASKAAAEIAIASYRRAFFSRSNSNISLASARAGNVLGGGDWASDRIVPDCIRALRQGKPIRLRHPSATRSWQHVLDLMRGYLHLGAALGRRCSQSIVDRASNDDDIASAFNFGPRDRSQHSVSELVQEVLKHWPGAWQPDVAEDAPHESAHLSLCSDKAFRLLGWSCAYDFPKMVERTVAWYRQTAELSADKPEGFIEVTRTQIQEYLALTV